MDQPQPVSWVLSVPGHTVRTQIMSTVKCHAMSCLHDLETGVLSDTSVDHPCGRRTDAAVTAEMLAPRRGPCPQDSPDCRRQRPHWGAGRGPPVLSVDEREEGLSRASF